MKRNFNKNEGKHTGFFFLSLFCCPVFSNQLVPVLTIASYWRLFIEHHRHSLNY